MVRRWNYDNGITMTTCINCGNEIRLNDHGDWIHRIDFDDYKKPCDYPEQGDATDPEADINGGGPASR